MSKLFFLIMGPCLFSLFTTAQSVNSWQQTRAEIEKKISESGAETIAVAVYDFNRRETLLINEKKEFHAASTMKVPVMMELFHQAASGKINLETPIIVKNQFSSIVDHSPYQLTKEDDSDDSMYQKIGQSMTARELMERMITRSSNLATNILIEKAEAQNVMQLMKKLGANDIRVRRGVEDNKAFRAGLNNTTTAYDLMILLRALIEKKFLPAKFCEEMIAILSRQEFNEGIPAGLPSNTRIAHKTGSITKIYHDAGIVFLPDHKPYVIVVLTRGLADQKKSHQLASEISRLVFQTINRAK